MDGGSELGANERPPLAHTRLHGWLCVVPETNWVLREEVDTARCGPMCASTTPDAPAGPHGVPYCDPTRLDAAASLPSSILQLGTPPRAASRTAPPGVSSRQPALLSWPSCRSWACRRSRCCNLQQQQLRIDGWPAGPPPPPPGQQALAQACTGLQAAPSAIQACRSGPSGVRLGAVYRQRAAAAAGAAAAVAAAR